MSLDSVANFREISYLSRFGLRRGSTKYHNNLGKVTTTEPEGWKIRGGSGEPRICRSPGKTREFHDGAGLASPGRWDLERRTWNTDGFWKKLREGSLRLVLESCGGWQKFDLECFQMAAKGEQGCNLVRDQVLQSKLVDLWITLLREEGYETEGLGEIADGQPFRLKLMQACQNEQETQTTVFFCKVKKVFQ